MNFGLTETQELIRSSAAEWLSENCGPDFVRAMAEDERGYTDEYWKGMAELGWLGMMVQEDGGGSGMKFADMAVLLREMGTALAPGPFVESCVIATSLVERGGHVDKEVGARLRSGIASGDVIVIPALGDWNATHKPSLVGYEMEEGWELSGQLRNVPYANVADTLLVPAKMRDGWGDDVAILALDLESITGSLTMTEVKVASGVPTFNLELNEVLCPARLPPYEDKDGVIPEHAAPWLRGGAMVGRQGDGTIEFALLLGKLARAAQMVGAGKAVLDRTVEYVKSREQFGRPIGSFQAIQHYLVDMALKVKSAQHLVDRAVWTLDAFNEESFERHAGQAKWAANTLIPEVCWSAHQIHGAIGFTWEHDLHLYTRRVLSWRAEYGDTAQTGEIMAAIASGKDEKWEFYHEW